SADRRARPPRTSSQPYEETRDSEGNTAQPGSRRSGCYPAGRRGADTLLRTAEEAEPYAILCRGWAKNYRLVVTRIKEPHVTLTPNPTLTPRGCGRGGRGGGARHRGL